MADSQVTPELSDSLECRGCGEILEDVSGRVYYSHDGDGLAGLTVCPSCGGTMYYDLVSDSESGNIVSRQNIRFSPDRSDTNDTDDLGSEATCPKCGTELGGSRDATPIFDGTGRRPSAYCMNCRKRLMPPLTDKSVYKATSDLADRTKETDTAYPPSIVLTFHVIYLSGPLPRREIRHWIGSHRTTVGRILRRLKHIGAIEQQPHPEDGRQSVYGVTREFFQADG
jgi:hypothetical protein